MMSNVDDWRAKIDAEDRDKRLRSEIKHRGTKFIAACIAAERPSAIERLQAFINSSEFSFIRDVLSRWSYDSKELYRAFEYSPRPPWPRGLLVLKETLDRKQLSTYTYRELSSIYVVTGEGFAEFYRAHSIWASIWRGGFRLNRRPLTSGALIDKWLLPYDHVGFCIDSSWSPWCKRTRHPDTWEQDLLPRTWEDWTMEVRASVVAALDVRAKILREFQFLVDRGPASNVT